MGPDFTAGDCKTEAPCNRIFIMFMFNFLLRLDVYWGRVYDIRGVKLHLWAGLALRDKAPRADQTLISARLAGLFQITNRHEKTTGLSFFYYLPQILFSIIRAPGKPWWNNRPRLTMCMKGKTDLCARECDSSVQSSCVPNFSPNVPPSTPLALLTGS